MAEKKYNVSAQEIVHYNFSIKATSKKKAIAKLKELLEDGVIGMSEGNPDSGDSRDLYAFDAFIDDDIDDGECF